MSLRRITSKARMTAASARFATAGSCPSTPNAPKNFANRTLTPVYNERPAWLSNAHCRLDVAVFTAYCWPADLADDEILAKLLELNLGRQPAS